MGRVRPILFVLATASLLVAQDRLTAPQLKDLLRDAQAILARGERQIALGRFEAGLVAARGADDKSIEASFHYGIAKTRQAMGEAAAALPEYLETLRLRKETGERFEEALVLHNLGAAYWALGRNEEALTAYEGALAVRRLIQDQAGIAYSLYGIAGTHWTWGDATQAMVAYKQALQLWRSLKNTRGEADTLSSIGLMHAALGDVKQARQHYEQSIAIWSGLKDAVGEAYALNNLGMVQGAAGYRTFEKVLAMLRAAGDRRGQAYVLHNLAGLEAPGSALAIERYRESLALKRQLEDRWGEAQTLAKLAGALGLAGQAEAALAMAREAIAIEQQIGDRLGEASAQAVEGSALRSLGRLDEAAASYRAALRRIEALRAGVLSPDLRTSFFATQQSLYRETIDVLMEAGAVAEAFDVSERSRARLLLDRVLRARENDQEDQAIAARQKEIEREINVLAQGLRRASSASARADLDRQLESWAALERKRLAAAGLDRWDQSTAARIQAEVLGAKTALVEYGFGAESAWAWVLTRDALRGVKLPGQGRLEGLVRRHSAAIAERKRDLEAERELYAAAIGRLGPLPGIERLVVAPGGPLERINLASLPKVLARFEIVETPSAAALLGMRDRGSHPVARNARLTIFSDAVFSKDDARLARDGGDSVAAIVSSGMPRLHFSRIEAEEILKLAPANARRFEGFAADLTHLEEAATRNSGILHLATHATASAVYLSQFDANGKPRNGRLSLDDIYRLRLGAGMVVLSACSTAAGPSVAGEGTINLARGFLYAGASRVLATQWEIEDRASAELMKRFYLAIFTGKLAPGAALRRAQLDMSADQRWASAYYWGAFRLTGDWR